MATLYFIPYLVPDVIYRVGEFRKRKADTAQKPLEPCLTPASEGRDYSSPTADDAGKPIHLDSIVHDADAYRTETRKAG